MELKQFLVKAKVGTYATTGEDRGRDLAEGCKELTYQDGEFRYRDRYFGWNPFVGQEVVWHGSRIAWAMNYYGVVLDDLLPATQVYAFLQKALTRTREDRPFRGPERLREGEYEYLNESHGSVDRFTGVETILYRGLEVYRLTYHGGSVNAQ